MPEQRVRDLVNQPRRLHALLSDRSRWHRICSALDAIGDTQLAIDTYRSGNLATSGHGALYLVLYGVLQVMYVQQDAIKDLAGALNIQLTIPPALRFVRDARNASVGHPTSYKHGVCSNTINRSSMSMKGFELYRWSSDGPPEITYIDVADLAKQQTEMVSRLLEEAAVALENEELEHRKRWRSDPLLPKLDDGVLYAFEKLSEGARNPGGPNMASWGLSAIEERIEKFKQALAERGLLGAPPMSVDQVFSELEHPLRRLKLYLDGSETAFTPADAAIFIYYVRAKFGELQAHATELDADYASDEV